MNLHNKTIKQLRLDTCLFLVSASLGIDQYAPTVSGEYGLIGDGGAQLVGGVADVFALVRLQCVRSVTERKECK